MILCSQNQKLLLILFHIHMWNFEEIEQMKKYM